MFTLVVTPNIVNEKNYIMDIEYPKAKENRKKILPFEMLETEGDMLRELYREIPTPIDPNNEKEFERALRDYLPIAIEKDEHNSTHNFFVGLAYLTGIDVEVDRDRAFDLIFSAAEDGLYEAMKKIVSMLFYWRRCCKKYRKSHNVAEKNNYKACRHCRRILK